MRICLATYHTPLQFQSKTTAESGKWSKPAAVRRRWSGRGGPGGRCRASRKAELGGLQSIDKVTANVTASSGTARVARAVTYSLVCGATHASADWRGGQQILALAAALCGEIGVAADHQAFAGKVGGGDAGHVALVEQRELQRAALQQRLDRRRAQ